VRGEGTHRFRFGPPQAIQSGVSPVPRQPPHSKTSRQFGRFRGRAPLACRLLDRTGLVAVQGPQHNGASSVSIAHALKLSSPPKQPPLHPPQISMDNGQTNEYSRPVTPDTTSRMRPIIGLSEAALAGLSRGAAPKGVLAWWLRRRTAVPLRWVSERLAMGRYTRMMQAVSRMNRRPGRRLQVLQHKLDRLPTGEKL
jgi:hypothetical protein